MELLGMILHGGIQMLHHSMVFGMEVEADTFILDQTQEDVHILELVEILVYI